MCSLLYNFKIIFYDKHIENIQAKHSTELISFEIQCFDSTFVDKLFKSVFKSLRFEKQIVVLYEIYRENWKRANTFVHCLCVYAIYSYIFFSPTELISFEIQCFDSTFVDKLFKSVFKSLRFEKHASKSYFKITTINYISFCFP
jgi:hypothetical protein